MSFQQYNVYDGLTSCRAVALANQAGTYINGPLNNGVGATFTYATGVLLLDGLTIVQGDSLALVGQTNTWENGIYICTQTGAVGISAILTRRQDMQCIEQLKVGQWTTIGAGTVSAGSMFVVVEPLPGLFGINPLLLSAAIPAGSGTASTKAASDNTKPSVASIGSAVVINHLAKFIDVAGTIDDTAGVAINSGSIQAGLDAVAGNLISFPPTTASGKLILSALDAGGAFDTTIRNSLMGQSTVYSIPDAGNAVGRFLVGATAAPFVAGEFPVASGTAGLMLSSGVAATNLQRKTDILAKTTADIGGGGAGPLVVAEASLTAASVVVATVESSSNPVSVIACTAGAGNFSITFSADPGASCFVNYIAFVVAQ